MRTTIERVRAAVVVGAALVAMVVAGFLAMAHFRAHRLMRDLPERLGADIQKETNGYTYSQSVKGRTVFTLHAAKATQHKDGQTGLEDVGIVLYGQKDGRADRIYGKQFEYDQKNGVVRAMGEVQLDLQAPAPASASARAEYARGGKAEAKPSAGDMEAQPIHVVTSGLVYVQGLGVASTDQPIRFSYRGMTGQARGAAYNSDTGVTTLESEVTLSALREGRPTVLTAAHAEMDRVHHRLTLRTAHYVALSKEESARSESETMAAGTMVVHLGQEGGEIESAEGTDGVEVASGENHMQAPTGTLTMNAEGRPAMAEMSGGVQFRSRQERPQVAGDTLTGRAAQGVAHFDQRGVIEAVRLTGGVQARSEGGPTSEMREMSGEEMDLRLGGDASGSRRWVQQATMRGEARVQTALPAVQGHTAGSEEMRGDVLVGEWRQDHGEPVLQEMTGNGHTEIRRSRDGVDEVSRGDRLTAEFGVVAKEQGGRRSGITTATQQGSVGIERRAPKKGATGAKGGMETTRAKANRASYDAATGHVSLTGGTEIEDTGSRLRAERVVMTEETGDAEAEGAVQVTYRQAATEDGSQGQAGADSEADASHAAEPVHVMATRAVMKKETGIATFYGEAAESGGEAAKLRARIWQGGSQVEAPVLVFGREDSTLDAYGTAKADAMPVRTVLMNRASDEAARGPAKGGSQVLRIQSGRLHYSDVQRRAEFSKGVVLDDADGTMTSRDAVALLAPARTKDASGGVSANATPPAGLGGLSGGELERVTATHDVVIRQPGRVATGQQAVYTTADGMFVLTGGGGVPPKVVDDVNGSVTGAALRFRSGDNSVTVEGRTKPGEPMTGDGRVHTHTKVKQ